ncbi:hypothetical protein [Phaeovulum sp.]|uniref:hypothetical protein n=1 Tax=Phaeovulum sp. TaxID=2934796 RepID=UPI002730FC7E|nr:hypothetical protein [Phaeovulum sp.]MDP1668278.1 hypothetical protein [Phaeovulum sp.]MDP2063977.1 hypothetical protein [Phaeovulum sp.]MDP3861298.1 hypothetical protein [Phaeovulum sp.]MDZ4118126.1 hypothetical protein [Phaeovulum sp.]
MRKISKAVAGGALVGALLVPSFAFAEPSCTSWMDQGNGTSWKTCVGDDGKQRCYEINNAPGSTSREVTCS